MGLPAARKTDPHPQGPIKEGSPNVFINGLPAARKGDLVRHHHGSEPIVEGAPNVFINGLPAARMSDRVACDGVITAGSPNVNIGLDHNQSCLQDAADQGSMTVIPNQ